MKFIWTEGNKVEFVEEEHFLPISTKVFNPNINVTGSFELEPKKFYKTRSI